MRNLFDIKGKVVIITGALGQLGTTLSKNLAEQGAIVIITDVNNNKCEIAASLLNEKYPDSSLGISCDITQLESIKKMSKKVYSKYKKIDCLVNNAGIGVFTPFEDRNPEDIQNVMDVNIKGTVLCSQVISKYLKKANKGSIINIASVYGIVSSDYRIYGDSGRNNSEIYSITKAGIINFTKYLGTYLAKDNVRVNAISPGGIYNKQTESFVENYVKKTPLSRMAKTEDFVGAVIYLISDASEYMTGNNLIIDGGFTAW